MGNTVLYINSDPAWREQVVNTFASADLKVVSAGTAQEALQRAETDAVSLMVLDVELQGEKTTTLLQFLKANHPGVPIVLFTDVPLEDARVQPLLASGLDDYVQKGTADDLLIACCKLFRN